MRAFPAETHTPDGWLPPRGYRDGEGWESTLAGRELLPALDGEYQMVAVVSYRAVIAELEAARVRRHWSQRELAARAGVSQAATSKALSGAAWPRWPTLVALVDALGYELTVDGVPADPITAFLALLDGERELTGKSVAAEVGIRPNTLFDLRKPGRAPSAASVFPLAAWATHRIDVRQQ